jgi:hypothetical protein
MTSNKMVKPTSCVHRVGVQDVQGCGEVRSMNEPFPNELH